MRDEELENTGTNQHEPGAEKGPKETGTPPSSAPGNVLAKGASEHPVIHAKGPITYPWWHWRHWL